SEYVQVVEVGEDLGMQTGPIINPELFRKLIKPRDEKIFKFIKKKADVYLLLHSCGSIYKFIPDLIEMGVDALNPVQVSAKDMDTKKLKEEFGEKITFWGGGCNTQHILPHGSPEDVINEVKKRIKDLAPGGGFIFTQVHNIQADVPSENIVAMFETVKKYGWYPIKNIS
ncbi:MAG: uroporphyrinogen decarboxylase family protein, partial [Nitrososphaerota archaeon]